MKVSIPDVGTVAKEQEIVNWTIENCKSYIKMEATICADLCTWKLNFYFNDSADASWFLLRWS